MNACLQFGKAHWVRIILRSQRRWVSWRSSTTTKAVTLSRSGLIGACSLHRKECSVQYIATLPAR